MAKFINIDRNKELLLPPNLKDWVAADHLVHFVIFEPQIERATYENVAVRLLCADTHPDHDTPCALRRKNGALLSRAFAQVLELGPAAGC